MVSYFEWLWYFLIMLSIVTNITIDYWTCYSLLDIELLYHLQMFAYCVFLHIAHATYSLLTTHWLLVLLCCMYLSGPFIGVLSVLEGPWSNRWQLGLEHSHSTTSTTLLNTHTQVRFFKLYVSFLTKQSKFLCVYIFYHWQILLCIFFKCVNKDIILYYIAFVSQSKLVLVYIKPQSSNHWKISPSNLQFLA